MQEALRSYLAIVAGFILGKCLCGFGCCFESAVLVGELAVWWPLEIWKSQRLLAGVLVSRCLRLTSQDTQLVESHHWNIPTSFSIYIRDITLKQFPANK